MRRAAADSAAEGPKPKVRTCAANVCFAHPRWFPKFGVLHLVILVTK